MATCLRTMAKTKVLASGKFDILHPGHLYYLKESLELVENSELWVVIAHEANVENCVFSNQERKGVVEALEFVDEVVVGRRKISYEEVLRKVRPDLLALGFDQESEGLEKILEELDMEIKVVRVSSLKPEKYSSSRIKKEIKG